MNTVVKIGLIGCGFMGSIHADCYRELSGCNVNVIAVCDINEVRARETAAKFRCKAYTDAAEMIKSADIDTVDICLPTYLHAKYGKLAMENGKNLFLEKPVCINEQECKELIALQKKSGVSVMAGQVVRMWPQYRWLSDTIKLGTYGRILSAQFHRASTRPMWPWEHWLEDPEKGGTMALDFHIHDVDFMRSVLGEPKSVRSSAARDRDGVIQQIFSAFEYDGAVVTVDGCWENPQSYPFSSSYKVTFERATAVMEDGTITVYPIEGGKMMPEIYEDDEMRAHLGAYYTELKYFTERIENGLPVEVATLEDGALSVGLVLEEIRQAGGAKVTVK